MGPILHICQACGEFVRLQPDLQGMPEVPGTCLCGADTWFYRVGTFLPMWTIYDHPRDCPEAFVARLHLSVPTGAFPTGKALKAGSLAELRKKLPGGLTCIARSPIDDPVIVETWL